MQRRAQVLGAVPAGARPGADRPLDHLHVVVAPFHEALVEVDEALCHLRGRAVVAVRLEHGGLNGFRLGNGLRDVPVEGNLVALSVEIAEERGVYAAVGIHPNSADGWSEETAREIETLGGDERTVAIGETGIDLYWDRVPLDVQKRAFVAHIELAKRLDKTLVIHTRESMNVALDVLSGEGPPDRVIFHCWSGDEEQLKSALDLGAFISFAGNTSFKSADDLRSSASLVPGPQLLVETDSPFLTPVPHRGKPNEPRHVPFVGTAVADARQTTVPEISDLTTSNARRAFALVV